MHKRTTHTYGKEKPHERYSGGTIFVDLSSDYVHLRNQVTLAGPETVKGKRTVYVLEPKLQDGKKIPKWQPRARRGQFLGFFNDHATTVALIVSPQFHMVFDELYNHDDYHVPDNWEHLFRSNSISFPDGEEELPPLQPDWYLPERNRNDAPMLPNVVPVPVERENDDGNHRQQQHQRRNRQPNQQPQMENNQPIQEHKQIDIEQHQHQPWQLDTIAPELGPPPQPQPQQEPEPAANQPLRRNPHRQARNRNFRGRSDPHSSRFAATIKEKLNDRFLACKKDTIPWLSLQK